jgi:dihydrofolate synthase/folylpolyglutamate synthase
MKRLCAELGDPQRSYATLHVVGTNGKSSVTSMAAAVLHAHGLRTGSCLSPHAWRWSERTRLDGAEIEPGPFAGAVTEVAAAVERLDDGDERVTQFEAAIATSFVAFARAGVDVAVIEAGLGGRLDATNVIDSRATALTSVGLDHTEWLGETELEIAREKLAVLRPGTALVLGDVSAEVERLARAKAAELAAEVIRPEPLPEAALPGATAPYLRRNAAVAVALARVLEPGIGSDAIAAGLAAARLPGRAESLGGDPPLLADAAHNVQGARALAEALPALTAGRPAVGCLSILADKDREGIVEALAPALDAAVCTAAEPGPAMGRPGARAADPAELAWMLEARGVGTEVVGHPAAAVERTLALAAARGGVAVCAGSHYLLRYAWTARHVQNSSR